MANHHRWENVKDVDMEVDAAGWPRIIIFPAEGNAEVIYVRSKGVTDVFEDRSHENKIF